MYLVTLVTANQFVSYGAIKNIDILFSHVAGSSDLLSVSKVVSLGAG